MRFSNSRLLVALVTLGLAPGAHAQFPVIDVAAVAQLITQVKNLEEQLLQAQAEFNSITGPRGMERLLEGTVRNYLPGEWGEWIQVLEGGAAVGDLARQIRRLIEDNAVLTEEDLAGLAPVEREQLEAARRTVAMLQAVTRDALETTSARFDSLQKLIDAIPDAGDQKAALDLQARIQAEHGMLQNEATKLQVLFQTAQAEEWARRQRAREDGIAAIGSLRHLPPLGL